MDEIYREWKIWIQLWYILSILVIGNKTVEARWEIQDSGGAYNVFSVYFYDKNKGVAVGEAGNKIIITEDGGITWQASKIEGIDLQHSLYSVCFSNSKVGWIGGQIHPGGPGNTVLLKTEDGGKTWVSKPLPDSVTSIWRIYFDKDGKKGWLISYIGHLIWKTEDGGITWTGENVGEVHPKVKANPTHPGFYAFNIDRIFLAGQDGIVIDVANRIAVETGLPDVSLLTAIHFFDQNVGWAVGVDGLIIHTKDAGKTWQRQESGVKNLLRNVWALSQDEAWITGEAIYTEGAFAKKNGVLLHTTDGGKTWKDENPTTSSLRGLFFLDKGHGWAVGGKGGSASEPPGMILTYTEE